MHINNKGATGHYNKPYRSCFLTIVLNTCASRTGMPYSGSFTDFAKKDFICSLILTIILFSVVFIIYCLTNNYLKMGKGVKSFLGLVILVLLISACSGNQPELRVMSFNIRYDNPRDGINTWNNRKEMVVETILDKQVDIVGMQEVLLSQQKYLEERLDDYDFYAVGREDGITKGEMGSVFYLRERFEVLDKSTFWLSETPEVAGSKGWNAVLPRIVSWIKFHDLENKREFFFFNTHFSHVGDEARAQSARLLVEQVVNIAGDEAVIISGDFNCTYDSRPYEIITATDNGLPPLFDTHYISETEHFGGLNSINAFGRSSREAIIDYIFCNDGFSVSSHGILTIRRDSVYISDHYPVISSLVFKE